MPEGPEIHFACKYINRACANAIFTGKVEKSEVSKNPAIPWDCEAYKISSKSRGKELLLNLTRIGHRRSGEQHEMDILFHFGMSGFFQMTRRSELPKHAHLRFHTSIETEAMTLSFVDTRRFGSWKVSSAWSPDRGPDPVFEYNLFRENVVSNLDDAVFKKPICESMLSQAYFNGIGNYLRAEILYRASVMPFSEARSVLENLCGEVKQEQPDLLQLCHDVPLEAMNLEGTNIYDPLATEDSIRPFVNWLQCYNKPSMNSLQDHNKRTIWFYGKPGSLVPKSGTAKKTRRKKTKAEMASSSNASKEGTEEMDGNKKVVKLKKGIVDVQSAGAEKPPAREMRQTRSRKYT